MSPGNERLLAHARAVRARGAAMPPDGLPPADILDSWVRCMDAGLDLGVGPRNDVASAAEVARRRDSVGVLRRLALAELETLFHQIAGSNFLLAFADREGVILDLYADNRFATSSSGERILLGSRWSEDVAGTNGLGTALATGRSVAVNGLEHFFFKFGDISCTASPIRGPRGDIVGVLDASSYYESRQRHTQALVQMAATHIENLLFGHELRGDTVIAIHPRAEFLGTVSAGLLAFDVDGRLLALTARAQALLAGLDTTPGRAFEQIFHEPFELALARLLAEPEVRLRDAMGSTLHARGVHFARARPMPALPAWHVTDAAAAPAHAGLHAPVPARDLAAAFAPSSASARTPHGHAGAAARRGAPPPPAPADAPMLAGDPAVREAVALVESAARLRAPVLICGETGTGKELLARHAHAASGRRGAFVAVNCGALPAELFEAELFGYAGGAFTGSRREGSPGLIASADGGTLLLDEVRELPLQLQAALLRFLDDRLVRPVGGTQTRRVDVQLLAATNADLADDVAAQRFRADLLYRLDTVRAALPPLRERRDFAAAVRHVLREIDASASIDDDSVARLSRHAWPGNFRELRAVLTRALLGARSSRLALDDVERVLPAAVAGPAPGAHGSQLQRHATEVVLREFEHSGRCVARTARALGISRTTVYRHLREAGRTPARPG